MSANAGRRDLDAIVRMPTLAPGEPVFVLRAQDLLSGDTVRAWASLAHAAGVDPAVVEQALHQAEAMDTWRGQRKLPDADHLTGPERLQLAYEHSRRAWAAGQDTPDPRIVLAERRGWDAAVARMRAPKTASETYT